MLSAFIDFLWLNCSVIFRQIIYLVSRTSMAVLEKLMEIFPYSFHTNTISDATGGYAVFYITKL